MEKSNYFVVFGKLPPPIGGVRIHVARLIAELKKASVSFVFVNLQLKDFFRNLKIISYAKFFHLHTSNYWIRFLFSVICMLFSKKLFITYHGEIGRFGLIGNFLDKISIKLAGIPITLNKKSFKSARKYNPNARLISAFIPPEKKDIGDSVVIGNLLSNFRAKNFKFLFCTNAYGVTFDKNGVEIYGVCKLVRVFNNSPEIGLIISDPSGDYSRFFVKQRALIGNNILLLNFPHDFYRVLEASDCFIRATSTDGDSLSIYESLMHGKTVFASDCVDRPNGCVLFSKTIKEDDLQNIFLNFKPQKKICFKTPFTGLSELLALYKANL